MSSQVIAARVPAAMADQLAELARKLNAPESFVIRTLLRGPLERAVEEVRSPEDALRLQKLASTPRAANA